MNSAIDVFIERDGLTREQALEMVASIKRDIAAGLSPQDALELNGLEIDYILDFL